MSTILVTGGAGYIGAHVCKALARAGMTPVTLDNLVYGHERAVKWGPFERGDIADGDFVRAVIARHQPRAVIHLAAFAYVGESVSDPGRYYRNNVVGSLTLLEAMRDLKVRDLVFSSTCATYGEPEQVPITEAEKQQPINPYGASKLMMERMMADFCAAHGMRAVALRYFNVAGADPEGEIGESHDPETHLIPLVLEAALGQREAITLFGDDYPTPDGSCIRDYLHVSDLADAHLKALTWLGGHPGFDAFNLGNEQGASVREVVETARRVTGREIPLRIGARRAGDPPVLVASSARAHQELGWRPQLGALADQIETAWRWTLSQHG
ncbi:UDP-glucose 4-epimerase GalE [Magnetofaba australis]|uniref:UDP-glucose 4-epimerase n=1 Tax=Magnetofaba australis IT-1 TaxID=1434232 RepID=A0A1Y2K639_9PROT|nr:UDP-glucose 4-epimerase GalE [Magnetofaba australis]OSM04433.1 putative UDP-glucose 4-epimerase [Magnetofaba australis IT-1]